MKWKRWLAMVLLMFVLIPAGIFAIWAYVSLRYTYSMGERAGYVQKISKKGWLCKTWEGELAMATLPGTIPQIFNFTVRDEKVAREIQSTVGQRVAMSYAEHRGVPSTCFGETPYFVNQIHVVTDPAPPSPFPSKTPEPSPPDPKPL